MAQQLSSDLNYQKGNARAAMNIASSYWSEGEYERALSGYFVALELYKEFDDIQGVIAAAGGQLGSHHGPPFDTGEKPFQRPPGRGVFGVNGHGLAGTSG